MSRNFPISGGPSEPTQKVSYNEMYAAQFQPGLQHQQNATYASQGQSDRISLPTSTYDLRAQGGVSYYANAVYYPNWKVYRDKPPSSLSLAYISHIFYAFAW